MSEYEDIIMREVIKTIHARLDTHEAKLGVDMRKCFIRHPNMEEEITENVMSKFDLARNDMVKELSNMDNLFTTDAIETKVDDIWKEFKQDVFSAIESSINELLKLSKQELLNEE